MTGKLQKQTAWPQKSLFVLKKPKGTRLRSFFPLVFYSQIHRVKKIKKAEVTF